MESLFLNAKMFLKKKKTRKTTTKNEPQKLKMKKNNKRWRNRECNFQRNHIFLFIERNRIFHLFLFLDCLLSMYFFSINNALQLDTRLDNDFAANASYMNNVTGATNYLCTPKAIFHNLTENSV